ncbi:unnamed protein product [Auanema sp. JU1783]|nr:unnamed protein product [Auanema sp. JU1783]
MLREIARHVDWVTVGGRWTRFSVMGTDLSKEALNLDSKGEEDNRVVILMIPGNPGNEGFYADFGKRLLRSLLARAERIGDKKSQFLFYTVSHLNHVVLPNELRSCAEPKYNDRFLLDVQVQHKLDFVKEYLPKGNKIYVLGHSIGSYMMLRILPYIKDDYNIRKAIALFPTIEKMAETPNGLRLKRLLSALDMNDWLTKSLTFWLDCLPVSLKKWLVSFNLGDAAPAEVVSSAAELLHMHVFRNIVHMSSDELEKVCALDEQLISNPSMIYFYYGTTDGWCPLSMGTEMESRMPKGHVVIDDKECEHAFVIRDGAVMADKLLQFF